MPRRNAFSSLIGAVAPLPGAGVAPRLSFARPSPVSAPSVEACSGALAHGSGSAFAVSVDLAEPEPAALLPVSTGVAGSVLALASFLALWHPAPASMAHAATAITVLCMTPPGEQGA